MLYVNIKIFLSRDDFNTYIASFLITKSTFKIEKKLDS